MRLRLVCAVLVALSLFVHRDATAETKVVKIALLAEGALTGPVYIAEDKGYCAAQGLDCRVVPFDAALSVSMAVVSGDVDVAITGLTAAFYKLASQGALKIIAGYGREAPTFHAQAVVASKSAYAAGLTSAAKLGGHSVAISQIGGSTHYSLGLLATKYGFDLKSVQVLPLQSNPNAASAVTGGRADAGVIPGRYVMPSVERGDVKLLAWVGDEVPWQLGATITSAKKLRDEPDVIARFLVAYREGVRDYHDAFTGPNERRQDGPTTPEILKILSKYTKMSPDALEGSVGYIDADAKLDVPDIQRQIDWYKSQGLLSGNITARDLLAPTIAPSR